MSSPNETIETGAVVSPPPLLIHLPSGQDFYCYGRDQLAAAYQCSHVELGRLLRDKISPLPVRHDNTVLWFLDEVEEARASVVRTLERWRRRR